MRHIRSRPADLAPVNPMARLAQVLVAVGGLILLAACVWAGVIRGSNVLTEGAQILDLPWGVVTLIDLYFGFFIAACLIIAFERRWWVGFAWAVPLLLLGNLVTALWFVIRFPTVIRRLM